MTGFHAEAADFLAFEVFRLSVLVLVLFEDDALGAVGDGAAEDDEVVALSYVGARGDGAEGQHVGRAVGKRWHGLGEAARDSFGLDVELLLLVIAFLHGDDDRGDLDVLAEDDHVQVFGVLADRVVVLRGSLLLFLCGAARAACEPCSSCEPRCGCCGLHETAPGHCVEGRDGHPMLLSIRFNPFWI